MLTSVGYFYYRSDTVMVGAGGGGGKAMESSPPSWVLLLLSFLSKDRHQLRAASAMSVSKGKFKDYTPELTDYVCFAAPFLGELLANISYFLNA